MHEKILDDKSFDFFPKCLTNSDEIFLATRGVETILIMKKRNLGTRSVQNLLSVRI